MPGIDSTSSNSSNLLFSPIKLNSNVTLQHRIALAPLTRYRSTKEHVPIVELVAQYYSQRGCVKGTFLITEATAIAEKAGGYENIPGIWSEDQINAWKKVVDAVHSKESFIYLQLWALGRTADVDILKRKGYDLVSASDIPISETREIPRPLAEEEIAEYVDLYAKAAENAIQAGFDGVEIHAANGYLIDQFIQDISNQRTDGYGGSVENRARFALEVVDAVTTKIGEDKVGIRLNPYSTFNGMKMKDPVPQFSFIVSQLADRHPSLSYIHFVEPRTDGGGKDIVPSEDESIDFARKIWKKTKRPFLVCGGYTPEFALEHMREKGKEYDVVVFGRWYISNPDLVKRIEQGAPLNKYNRETIYTPESAEGYIDYPFL